MTNPKNLKELLKSTLTKKQLKSFPRSFDVVGDIIIFSDFPDLPTKEKILGQKILDNFKNIKVILKKTGKYSGKFRTPKLKIIAGQRRKETTHTENGVKLKLHVENVYFSTRSSNERQRITTLIKPREKVLVMFSGAAPYVCNISKNSKASEVYGVEINPVAHKYALENIKLNKLKNTLLLNQDVNEVDFDIKFDRILMPLPKGAESYLTTALTFSKKNTIIHIYLFLKEDDFNAARQKIKAICKQHNKKCKILRTTKCGQLGPQIYRVCIDFMIE